MADQPRPISTLSALAPGLHHPEGVAWGPDRKVYAGGEAGQVYRINLDDGMHQAYTNTGGFVLGMAHDALGNVYACDQGLAQVVKVTPPGEVSKYSAGSAERAM